MASSPFLHSARLSWFPAHDERYHNERDTPCYEGFLYSPDAHHGSQEPSTEYGHARGKPGVEAHHATTNLIGGRLLHARIQQGHGSRCEPSCYKQGKSGHPKGARR